MPPAIIGGAIAGVGAIGSAVVGSKAASKAANAATEAADKSAEVQREIYGQNKEILTPFVSRGNVAGDTLNALLGLPSPRPATAQGGFNNALATGLGIGQYYANQPGGTQTPLPYGGGIVVTPGQLPRWPYSLPTQQAQPDDNGIVVTPQSARDSFAQWLDNSDYAYQSALGDRAVRGQMFGGGVGLSGATLKALQDRQNNINQGFRGEYFNLLGNQQGVALGAGSALAGVGQNYANSLGNIYSARGDAIGNAALAKAQNSPFNALALIGGTILGKGL